MVHRSVDRDSEMTRSRSEGCTSSTGSISSVCLLRVILTAVTSQASSQLAVPRTFPTTSIWIGASQANARCPPGPPNTLPSPEMTTSDASATIGAVGLTIALAVQTIHRTRSLQTTHSMKRRMNLFRSQRRPRRTTSLSLSQSTKETKKRKKRKSKRMI